MARTLPRRPTPAELVRGQVAIEAHALSDDGTWLVYVRRTVVRGAYRRHLWRVAAYGGRARRLTSGDVKDTCPTISPDGRRIAFLRSSANPSAPEAERQPQAWVMDAAGTPRPLGRLPHGVEGVSWSPDSRTLALLAPAPEPRFLIGERNAPNGKGSAPTARRITRMDFRNDDGYRDRRTHLWLVAPRRGARPRQLTRGDFDVQSPAWSPDGRSIAFTADCTPDAVVNPRTTIWVVSVADGRVRELAGLRGDLQTPAWSPDGRWLAALGTDVEDPPEALQPEVWLIDTKDGGARSLSAHLDLPAGVWVGSHLNRTDEAEGPIWLDDTALVALLTVGGRSVPWRFDLDGHARPLVDPDHWFIASGLQAANGTVVVNAQIEGNASELAVVGPGGVLRLTSNGSSWQRRLSAPRLEEILLPGPAGPIQTWVYSPAEGSASASATRPGHAPPVVLDIHGGPTGAWGPGTSLDVLALTAAGYRVVRPNIRGSAGFGAKWVDGLGDRWGEVDAEDIHAVTDGLITNGLAEEGRIGVLGLSYGGFLVNWMIGVTDRFAAAVSENGVTNQVTAWAECHFGIYDTRRTGLGDPLSEGGMFALWSHSPLRNVANIHTPLLMLQAEEDRVCPASDNVQLFAALRALGREVEYILYPEEHHVMQSIGRPDRRVDRLERILTWFADHLR